MKRHGTEAQYRVPRSNPTLFLAGRFAGDPRHIANTDEAPIVDLERYPACLGVEDFKCIMLWLDPGESLKTNKTNSGI